MYVVYALLCVRVYVYVYMYVYVCVRVCGVLVPIII